MKKKLFNVLVLGFSIWLFTQLPITNYQLPTLYAGFAEGLKKYTAGNFEGAIPEFESALEQDKENERIKKYLLTCYFIVWEKYQREKNYEKALTYLEKAHELDPESPEVKKLYETVIKEAIRKVVLGTSVETKGEVYVQRKGKEGWEKVEPNSPVYPTDTIKTAKDSGCGIAFDEGTVMKIEANTEVAFETLMTDDKGTLKVFDVKLAKGRTLCNVEKLVRPESKFKIRTSVCVTSARGTEFTANAEEDKTTEIAVFDGVVTVANLPRTPEEKVTEVVIEKGKQTVVKPGEPPSPPADLSEKQAAYLNEVVPQFEQYVKVTREELELIALRRAEYIKQKQKESEQESKVVLEKIASLRREGETAYQKGKYNLALKRFEEITVYSPEDIEGKTFKDKLTKIVKIVPEETNPDKVSKLLRIGLTAYLKKDGNPKLAINALRYAAQLEPKNEKVTKVRELIETEYSTIAAGEKLVPGMSLAEQKLLVALNSIYDGRYDVAILECNEVLAFEPDNITAYKRLGSAYWSLGKKDEARKVWQEGLKYAPQDEELKSALKAQ